MSEKKRVYNITMGKKVQTFEAYNSHYAAVEGLKLVGYKVATLKRGRGQKATLDEAGTRTYPIKSLWKKKGFTVQAVGSFDASAQALKHLGATLAAANKRGRPKGSVNKPKVVAEVAPIPEAEAATPVTEG